MRLAPEISLQAVESSHGKRNSPDDEEDDDVRPKSVVLVDRRPTGTVLSGRTLEAAVCCEPGWLLFVTDDVPFEEILRIYLLDEDGRLLDSARIGAPFATGVFSGLRLEPPDTAYFQFNDESEWAVTTLGQPQTVLPWWPDAKGVWRGSSPTRRFRVRPAKRAV